MKKKLLFLILIIFPFFSLAYQLPKAGITPESIFYPLDIIGEKIVLFFTFSLEKKIEKALRYAEEKLAEIQKLIEENKDWYAKKSIENYQRYLNLVMEKLEEIKEKKKKERQHNLVAEKILEYQKILLKNREKTLGEIKSQIEETFKNSQRQFEKIIEILPQEQKRELREKQKEIGNQFLEIKKEESIIQEREKEEREKEIKSPLFSPEEKTQLAKCRAREAADIFEIMKCYKELGRKFGKIKLCQQTSEISAIGSCLGGVAAKTNNLNLCSQLRKVPSSQGALTILLSTCFGAFAQIKKESNFCAQAPTFKSQVGCYLLMAGLNQDVRICDNITQGREGCYLIVASEKNDLSLCEEITNLEWKNLCHLTLQNEIVGKTQLCKIGENLGLFSQEDCLKELLEE